MSAAALQRCLDDRPELVAQRLPARRATHGEQPLGRGVELHHTATTVDGQHRVGRHAVGPREQAVAEQLLVERELEQQTLLDEGRRRLHGEERVRLDFLLVSRHVDHGDRLAGDRMADRCPGADPSLPGRNVVLGTDDLDGSSLRQGRADAVRTGGLLVPAPADAQIDLGDLLDDPWMTGSREHVAIGITQGEHVLRLAEVLAEPLENRGAHAQRFQPLPSLARLILGQHDRASFERRIDLKHVATAHP